MSNPRIQIVRSRCFGFLLRGNGLGLSGRQTLSTIVGNSAVDDRPAVDAFPGIEHEKEIREPIQQHPSVTLRTVHSSLLRRLRSQLSAK